MHVLILGLVLALGQILQVVHSMVQEGFFLFVSCLYFLGCFRDRIGSGSPPDPCWALSVSAPESSSSVCVAGILLLSYVAGTCTSGFCYSSFGRLWVGLSPWVMPPLVIVALGCAEGLDPLACPDMLAIGAFPSKELVLL